MSAAQATAPSIQDKLVAVKDAVANELVERSTIIDTQVLALVSQSHHFQLGPPGVAKSLSIQRIVHKIGGLSEEDYFETLMTRFSAPEEVFGPLDLMALKESKYRRQTHGFAPVASIWFLDEIWKANASILNAFLWALNERKFRNDGHVHEIPLWSMFCASNEMPEGEELNALYDRIQFRHETRPVSESGNFIQMLKNKIDPQPNEIVTWDEIKQAQKEAAEVEIPSDVLEALTQVRSDLRQEGIEPTDRRFVNTLKVIQAAAWLEGEDIADIEHMRPLAHMLWTTPDERVKVERMLLELANPLDKEAMMLLETVDKLAAELDKVLSDKDMDNSMKNKKGVELHSKVDRVKDDLTKLNEQVANSKRKSAKVDEVKARLLSVTRRLLKEIFGIDVEPTV